MLQEKQIRSRFTVLAVVLVVTPALLSCKIRTESGEGGENVEITTPIGELKVREGDASAEQVGVKLYPGARRKVEKDKDEENAANISLFSSFFGLKVVAVKYESDDAAEKIASFYRDELKKFGSVLDCRQARKTEKKHKHELTCDDDDNREGHITLKVGREERQRIVKIEPRGSGSDFALVYVATRDDEDMI
jgi:hypothetical protein